MGAHHGAPPLSHAPRPTPPTPPARWRPVTRYRTPSPDARIRWPRDGAAEAARRLALLPSNLTAEPRPTHTTPVWGTRVFSSFVGRRCPEWRGRSLGAAFVSGSDPLPEPRPFRAGIDVMSCDIDVMSCDPDEYGHAIPTSMVMRSRRVRSCRAFVVCIHRGRPVCGCRGWRSCRGRCRRARGGRLAQLAGWAPWGRRSSGAAGEQGGGRGVGAGAVTTEVSHASMKLSSGQGRRPCSAGINVNGPDVAQVGGKVWFEGASQSDCGPKDSLTVRDASGYGQRPERP
jgi:hypothetical protein